LVERAISGEPRKLGGATADTSNSDRSADESLSAGHPAGNSGVNQIITRESVLQRSSARRSQWVVCTRFVSFRTSSHVSWWVWGRESGPTIDGEIKKARHAFESHCWRMAFRVPVGRAECRS
jgi:hypothetical protein